jgi:hypothetical protein
VIESVADFLLARITDDEAVATSVLGWGVYDERPEVKEWIVLANPTRMLVWSGVRRNLVSLHSSVGADVERDGAEPTCEDCTQPMPCRTLRMLATLYADHPDFQEQWRN